MFAGRMRHLCASRRQHFGNVFQPFSSAPLCSTCFNFATLASTPLRSAPLHLQLFSCKPTLRDLRHVSDLTGLGIKTRTSRADCDIFYHFANRPEQPYLQLYPFRFQSTWFAKIFSQNNLLQKQLMQKLLRFV